MRPVSDAFLRSVVGSHSVAIRATVCSTFQTGTTPSGTRIAVAGGDVRLDGTAQIRGTLDMTVDGTGMWPRRATDLLAPYGNELYIERGIKYNDSLVEYVGLGYYRIDSPEQAAPPSGPIRITGSDRMAGIIDAKLLAPLQFLSGSALGDIVEQLVTDVYPDAVIVWDDATDTAVLTRAVISTEDRYAFLADLVASRGKIMWWNHRGELAIASVPDPAAPVFDVVAGPGGVLLGGGRALTRAGVINAVVATGQAADTGDGGRGVAVDNDANSPTRYGGPFGKVPAFYSSAMIASDGQALAAANAQLRQHLGLPYSVDLSMTPNPALEPYDAVSVRIAATEGRETHVLETITVPLDPAAAMTATTRQQTRTLT